MSHVQQCGFWRHFCYAEMTNCCALTLLCFWTRLHAIQFNLVNLFIKKQHVLYSHAWALCFKRREKKSNFNCCVILDLWVSFKYINPDVLFFPASGCAFGVIKPSQIEIFAYSWHTWQKTGEPTTWHGLSRLKQVGL